jgi:radical SAM protein with 4Fe4S-binding SPASM domain
MLEVKRHAREHYSVLYNPDTGFFARVEDEGHPEPFWSECGPELMDIAITNWCDRDCPMCYRNSDHNGQHMSVSDYHLIMAQAAELGVLQVALGGGNPNQHPDFCRILECTRRHFAIVPSYTTNGRGLSVKVVDASAEFCGAVAVSAYPPFDETSRAIQTLVAAGVRTNVHFVLTAESAEIALAWLKEPPGFLRGVNALVFLNYKPLGRRASGALLAESPLLHDLFGLMRIRHFPFKVGFDNCMVSALVSLTTIDPAFYDGCEAGRFSMFISEKLRAYPCSFMEPTSRGVPLDARNLLDAWQNGAAFRRIRAALRSGACTECRFVSTCMGGCPFFPEINLCSRIKRH